MFPKKAPANEKQPDGQLPDTLQNFSDTEKYPCSQTENKCATVYVVGHSHPVQCDGMGGWFEAFTGSVEGCGDTQSNPIVGPSDITVHLYDGAGLTCADLQAFMQM